MLQVNAGTLPGGCGMGYVSGYRYAPEIHPDVIARSPWMHQRFQRVDRTPGGCGWISGAFINTPECREVFETLNKKHRLEYMTPVRRNRNSGRKFFFAIWDTKKVRKT